MALLMREYELYDMPLTPLVQTLALVRYFRHLWPTNRIKWRSMRCIAKSGRNDNGPAAHIFCDTIHPFIREENNMRRKIAITGNFENHLAVFQGKAMLRLWHNTEWWLVIADVVAVFTTRCNQTSMSRINVVTRSRMSLNLHPQTAVLPPRAGATHQFRLPHPGLPRDCGGRSKSCPRAAGGQEKCGQSFFV